MGLSIRADLYSSEKSFKNVANTVEDYNVFVVPDQKKRGVSECSEDVNAKRFKSKTSSQTEVIKEKSMVMKLKSSHNSKKQVKTDNKRYSNSMKDAVKTTCKACNMNITVSKMNIHTKKTHFLALSKYIEIYGQLEILEAVYHRCGLCSEAMMVDNNTIVSHLKKKHTTPVAAYHAQFMRKTVEKEQERTQTLESKQDSFPDAAEITNMNAEELLSLFDKIIELL